MGINSDPVSLHKYLYANSDPANFTDPTGNFSIGSLMGGLNVMGRLMTLASRASTFSSIMDIATGEEELSAMDAGVFILSMYSPKIFSKVFKSFKPCNSFSGDTLVSTELGLRSIAEIKIGDKVWAYNEKTGENSLQEVVHLIQSEGIKELVNISLTSGEYITATAGHPFYLPSSIEWKDASKLVEGNILLNRQGLHEEVSNIVAYSKGARVYNLTVDNVHTFYVGKKGVLTHNKDVCNLPLNSDISMGKKFKDHYARHKNLLSSITGKSYGKIKVSGQEFVGDLRRLVDTGRLKFKGRGTLGKGQDEVNIYTGEGVTLVLKDNNEWVTLLKAGEGLDKAIMMITK